MSIQDILINTRTALEEQIAALNATTSTEYLWRQWHYLQNRIAEASGGTVSFDYEKLGEAIAKHISPVQQGVMQEGKVLIVTGVGETPLARSITINNIGDAPAIVAGAELSPEDGGGRTFAATPGAFVAPIAYDATNTVLDIQYLVDKA